MNNTSLMSGVIRGNTIELDGPVGLPDGQRVTVSLQTVPSTFTGEGLRDSFGGWAEDAAELEQFLEENRRRRKASR